MFSQIKSKSKKRNVYGTVSKLNGSVRMLFLHAKLTPNNRHITIILLKEDTIYLLNK